MAFLFVLIVNSSIITSLHGSLAAFLAWYFGSATISGNSLGSHALVLRRSSALVVIVHVLEWVVRALNTTIHRCFTCRILLEAFVAALSCSSGDSGGSCLINHFTLSVSLVLRSVAVDIPARVHHLIEVIVVVD